MKITLKDGSFKEYEEGRSIIEIAGDISEGLHGRPAPDWLTGRWRICVRC